MKKKRKIWLRMLIGLLIVLLAINFGIGLFFYNLAIERNVKDFLSGNEDLEVSAEAMETFLEGDWRTWHDEQRFQQLQIEAIDGIMLNGYFLEAKEPSNKVVLFAHGYLGHAKDMSLFGQHYVEKLGFHMVSPDSRGHGKSEGNYIGFGWHDRLDHLQWIEWIIEKLGEDVEIVLHGLSMGAATVLMTSGEDLPEQVKAIVADSPYSSVYQLFSYQLERMFHLPDIPFLPTLSLVTNMRAGYTLKEASALEQVKKAEVPILYVHGKEDTFVPTAMTENLYEATNSEAELFIVPGASHGESIVLEQEAYLDQLQSFLNRYIEKKYKKGGENTVFLRLFSYLRLGFNEESSYKL